MLKGVIFQPGAESSPTSQIKIVSTMERAALRFAEQSHDSAGAVFAKPPRRPQVSTSFMNTIECSRGAWPIPLKHFAWSKFRLTIVGFPNSFYHGPSTRPAAKSVRRASRWSLSSELFERPIHHNLAARGGRFFELASTNCPSRDPVQPARMRGSRVSFRSQSRRADASQRQD